MLIVLSASVVLVAVLLWLDGTYPTIGEGIRHSMFNVVSIATTTGFVTEDYEKWPAFLPVWLLFLSCITCSTGSTGGGIKMFRTLLLVRQARRELKLLVHPSAVIPIRIGGSAIPERVVYSVLAFIFLYFGTILVLTFALLATGLDLVSSFSAVVGSINNLGPGLGAVGPSTNFSGLTDAQTWICTRGHADRPPGNLQRAGAVHRDVLAEIMGTLLDFLANGDAPAAADQAARSTRPGSSQSRAYSRCSTRRGVCEMSFEEAWMISGRMTTTPPAATVH